jgi:predicted MPP superfamily phosphohydrolase
MKLHLPSIVFGLLLFSIGFGAHYVVLTWLRRRSSFVARAGDLGLLPCAILSALPSSARYLVLTTRGAWPDAVLATSFAEIMFVAFAALPLLALLAVGGRQPVPAPLPAGESDPSIAKLGRRRAIEAIGGAAVLGGTGFAVGWGATRGRHDYRLDEVAVRIPGLPRALDGYVIAQISDIHAGLFVGERELRDGADLIRAAKADLLVVTGDLVDFDARYAPALARALADLAPRDGVYAILGNHDNYAGADGVSDAVVAAGVKLLVNDGTVIRSKDGGGFALLGVDDKWAYRYGGIGPQLDKALSSVAPGLPRVLLSHQPDTFDAFAGTIALQLSGHTHGGQIAPAGAILHYRAGRYEKGGSTLYVNRGFGVAGPPVRIGVPPEITKLVLVAA